MTNQPTAALPYSDCVLLTVHGVTSDNVGLAKLRESCESALPGLIVESWSYGYVVPFRHLSEEVAEFIFRSVREKIENIWLKDIKGTSRRLYVVAHSFGTLAVVRALEMHIPDVQIEGLILLGSIVPRTHFWDGLVNGAQLRHPPLVMVRPFDRVVRFARLVGGGDSGRRGFVANGRFRALESFKNGGHKSYFPNDCGDVISGIRGGVRSVPLTSRDAWYGSLSILKRVFA